MPVRVVRDLVFAEPQGLALHADLYLPDPIEGAVPVIVWVHGGGWRFGDRTVGPDLSRFFAERGFAMAAVDYRSTRQAIFPAQAEDLKTAIRWLRATASEYGIDPERIGMWGVSAGAHLSAMTALAPDGMFVPADAPYADQRARVQAVVAGYGPYDFMLMDARRPEPGTVQRDPEELRLPREGMRSADPDSFESLLLGAPIDSCPERVNAANPLLHAAPGAPPVLIVHGLSDTVIPAHQSELLFEALAAQGNDVTLALVEGVGHGFLNRTHLDDTPGRRIEVRRRQGSEWTLRPVFPLVEGFFTTRLQQTVSFDGRESTQS